MNSPEVEAEFTTPYQFAGKELDAKTGLYNYVNEQSKASYYLTAQCNLIPSPERSEDWILGYYDLEVSIWLSVLRLHYLNDTLFLSEKLMNDQVIQLQVIKKIEHEKHYISKRSIRSIGSDLFIYNCMNCHSGFPFIKEEINLSKIRTSTQLAKVLNDVRHRSQQQVNLTELSKDEVIAIYEYIKGPKQGANE